VLIYIYISLFRLSIVHYIFCSTHLHIKQGSIGHEITEGKRMNNRLFKMLLDWTMTFIRKIYRQKINSLSQDKNKEIRQLRTVIKCGSKGIYRMIQNSWSFLEKLLVLPSYINPKTLKIGRLISCN
jgi:hypothetical protein